MSNKPFRFKQFTVEQDQCAMKIGTDGVLLGAWCQLRNRPYSILDIGAGTGLIALMLAQRSDAEMVDAMYQLAATEGIIACPEGAATLVGLKHLLGQGFLQPDDTVVLLNTGSGYKYLDLIKDSA